MYLSSQSSSRDSSHPFLIPRKAVFLSLVYMHFCLHTLHSNIQCLEILRSCSLGMEKRLLGFKILNHSPGTLCWRGYKIVEESRAGFISVSVSCEFGGGSTTTDWRVAECCLRSPLPSGKHSLNCEIDWSLRCSSGPSHPSFVSREATVLLLITA